MGRGGVVECPKESTCSGARRRTILVLASLISDVLVYLRLYAPVRRTPVRFISLLLPICMLLPALTVHSLTADEDTVLAGDSEDDSVAVVDGDADPSDATKDENDELATMQRELQRLRLQQELREARQRESQAALQIEGQRIEMELAIANQRQRLQLAELKAEQEHLQAQAAVEDAQHQAALRQLRQEHERRQAQLQQQEHELRELQMQNRRLEIEQEQAQARFQAEQQERSRGLAQRRFELQQMEVQLEHHQSRQKVDAIVATPLDRRMEPFVDGVLTISDRRIDLNEPIIAGTGDWIARRINYYNNDSEEYPIFLVIDYCPGGSMMDGEIILRAIAASKAPVHVVVKSFAASMAAIIVGDAEHSYALPNAMIMHHQPWSYTGGNLAQQKEWVKVFEQWAERMHGPTAERMGLTLEEFYAQMYEQSVTGDWYAFADEAQDLQWVQHIATEIREEDVRVRPQDTSPWQRRGRYWSNEHGDHKERVRLPRPRALDFYFLYNRDNRYFVGKP
ncbi:MAG: hypothetical protein EA401_12200 [Planctomycetota bacterium]|nr:MAG: hypothetical protein EA401_12200 [Planctomycetota bacterium]